MTRVPCASNRIELAGTRSVSAEVGSAKAGLAKAPGSSAPSRLSTTSCTSVVSDCGLTAPEAATTLATNLRCGYSGTVGVASVPGRTLGA